MSHTAPQKYTIPAGAVRNVAVSFSGQLDDDELLTGTPAIVDDNLESPEHLTLTNKAVSTKVLTINNVSTPIGEAVQFTVTGQQTKITYTIKITVSTISTTSPQSSSAQTLIGEVVFTGE